MNHIIINHPDGDILLNKIQEKVNQIREDGDCNLPSVIEEFQALINKIIEQDAIIELNQKAIEELTIEPNIQHIDTIKPEINTSKGQYVVALEDFKTHFLAGNNITKDKCYECVRNHHLYDDDGDMQSFSTMTRYFRQATEEEIKAYENKILYKNLYL